MDRTSSSAANPEILKTLSDLTSRWTSFDTDPMPANLRSAIWNLVCAGYAQIKLVYRVRHLASGEWVLLTMTVTGDAFNEVDGTWKTGWRWLKFNIAAKCPRDWFLPDHLTPADGVHITAEGNPFLLSITPDGELAKRPENRESILEIADGDSAPAKMSISVQTGRDPADSADTPKIKSPISPDVSALIAYLKRVKPPKGKETAAARDFCEKNGLATTKASGLIRGARRYPDLW